MKAKFFLDFIVGLFCLFYPAVDVFCQVQPDNKTKVPWENLAPQPYTDADSLLVKNSYEEEWKQVSLDDRQDAVERAREVVRQWGLDLEKGSRADRVDRQNKPSRYEVCISESDYYISVVFVPRAADESTGMSIEVRMRKQDFNVISILPGA